MPKTEIELTPSPAPIVEVEVKVDDAALVAAMTPEERRDAILNHPEYRALSKGDRIRALIYGEVPAEPQGNRHTRRARKAIARRNG